LHLWPSVVLVVFLMMRPMRVLSGRIGIFEWA
jgi:hypothetical protein